MIRNEGHVTKHDAKNTEGEVPILPDSRVKERMAVEVLPNSEGEEAEDTEDKNYDYFGFMPANLRPLTGEWSVDEASKWQK